MFATRLPFALLTAFCVLSSAAACGSGDDPAGAAGGASSGAAGGQTGTDCLGECKSDGTCGPNAKGFASTQRCEGVDQ